jgi:hypothetical protein
VTRSIISEDLIQDLVLVLDQAGAHANDKPWVIRQNPPVGKNDPRRMSPRDIDANDRCKAGKTTHYQLVPDKDRPFVLRGRLLVHVVGSRHLLGRSVTIHSGARIHADRATRLSLQPVPVHHRDVFLTWDLFPARETFLCLKQDQNQKWLKALRMRLPCLTRPVRLLADEHLMARQSVLNYLSQIRVSNPYRMIRMWRCNSLRRNQTQKSPRVVIPLKEGSFVANFDNVRFRIKERQSKRLLQETSQIQTVT